MPYLYVSQFDMSGLDDNDQFIEKLPVLADDKYDLPADGSQVVSQPFQADTVVIRLVCTTADINICVGENPESNQEHMLIPKGLALRARVKPGHRLAAVVNKDPGTAAEVPTQS